MRTNTPRNTRAPGSRSLCPLFTRVAFCEEDGEAAGFPHALKTAVRDRSGLCRRPSCHASRLLLFLCCCFVAVALFLPLRCFAWATCGTSSPPRTPQRSTLGPSFRWPRPGIAAPPAALTACGSACRQVSSSPSPVACRCFVPVAAALCPVPSLPSLVNTICSGSHSSCSQSSEIVRYAYGALQTPRLLTSRAAVWRG